MANYQHTIVIPVKARVIGYLFNPWSFEVEEILILLYACAYPRHQPLPSPEYLLLKHRIPLSRCLSLSFKLAFLPSATHSDHARVS